MFVFASDCSSLYWYKVANITFFDDSSTRWPYTAMPTSRPKTYPAKKTLIPRFNMNLILVLHSLRNFFFNLLPSLLPFAAIWQFDLPQSPLSELAYGTVFLHAVPLLSFLTFRNAGTAYIHMYLTGRLSCQ